MQPPFSTIGLIGKYGDPSIANTVLAVRDYLAKHRLEPLIDAETAAQITNHGMPVASRADIGARCDLAIVIGGDGTLLDAARSLSDYEIALVGVNLGRLGFLVDVSPHDMGPQLDAILAGNYSEERRLLLHAEVRRGTQQVFAGDALNDVVIHKWQVARMIEFKTSINGHYLHTHRSDGLIVSTPTGSTAYALSGGGPILHPALDALVLVPICPHTLSNRPIVVEAGSQIEVVVSEGGIDEGQISLDGQLHHTVQVGDHVHIAPKTRKLRLLHPPGYDYYQILRTKLHWAESPRTCPPDERG